MPKRATKRGAERTPLSRDADVLICGASFAGLAIARELAGAGARVLMIDRYEVGERQTSACGIPTGWLRNLGLMGSFRQEFPELTIHTPHVSVRYDLPWSFATFDYPELCALLQEQGDADFEIAKVDGRTGNTVHTDRGDLTAPLIVDGLGWRRVLSNGPQIQPPDALLSRGLEVHPSGASTDLEVWIDRSYVPAGYGWSFPARDEVRIGVGSFDPRFHVKDPTLALTADLGQSPDGFQGNWIPHKLRPATEDGIFFAGDSAGHCLPLTAEGIRTALYFGLACGRELRAVVAGEQTREAALARYGAFSAGHRFAFDSMLRVQRLVPRIAPRALSPALRAMSVKRFVDWSFDHYLKIAHPAYALGGPHGTSFASKRGGADGVTPASAAADTAAGAGAAA
jgi:digeranylgeranylglycerophospholipid reductase